MTTTIRGSDNFDSGTPVTAALQKELKSGRKNLIINGGFDVWQRGTSYSYPNNLTYQCADRWRFQRTASSKVTTPYGNGVRITDNGQGYDMFEQVVEGHPSLFLAGQSYTFSFYVRASTPLSGLTAKMWGNTTNTGVIDENYTATSGWVKHTFTGTVASTLNEGMRVSPAPASINLTSGQWVEFAQVQLELGSVATDFEHRSYGEELALCQRYFEVVSTTSDNNGNRYLGVAWSATDMNVFIPFLQEKRANPSVSISGLGQVYTGAWGTCTGGTVEGASKRGCTINMQKSSGYTIKYGYFIRGQGITADAEL